MKRFKAYISGPMSGLPDNNYPAFSKEEARLRGMGITVVNPAANGLPANAEWNDHMREDIRMLMDCSSIHMLPGWQKSRGATLEHQIAVALGFAVTGAVE
jgi:hypothetical protein